MFALALLSCASVIPLYEEARTEALSDPGAPGGRWQPDARIDLSEPVLDDLLSTVVVGTTITDVPVNVGVGSLSAKLEIRKFGLVPQPPDGQLDGLAADIRIAGPVTAKTPLGAVEQQVGAQGRLVATLSVEPRDGGYAVVVHPKRLERLEIDAEGLASQVLSSSLGDLVVAAIPAFDVTTLPADALPVRAVRVERTDAGVTLLLRSAAPDGAALPDLPAPPGDGFRVAISAASLQQLARRQAFLADPLQHDVVPEPTSLRLANDGAFVLGLRLWRPVGRGWWRTCEVKGAFEVKNGHLKIRTDSVEEVDQSQGAAFADPLMALAEGVVFRTMERALDVSVPAMRTDKLAGGARAATVIERVDVVGQAVLATGQVELTEAKKRRRGPGQ